jgi:SAM-dependent methyltransferase
MLCPLCGSDNNKIKWFSKRIVLNKEVPMLKCVDCSFVFYDANKVTNVNDIYTNDKYFSEMLPSYINEEGFYSYYKSIAKKISEHILNKFSDNPALLEIGCGYGYFLKVMQHKGYTVYGVEPNSVAKEVSKLLNTEIVRNLQNPSKRAELVARAAKKENNLPNVIK